MQFMFFLIFFFFFFNYVFATRARRLLKTSCYWTRFMVSFFLFFAPTKVGEETIQFFFYHFSSVSVNTKYHMITIISGFISELFLLVAHRSSICSFLWEHVSVFCYHFLLCTIPFQDKGMLVNSAKKKKKKKKMTGGCLLRNF